MDKIIIIPLVIALVMLFLYLLGKLANGCFDDTDPDMQYYDNYAVIACPHTGEKTDVCVASCVTCETIHTVCDDCGTVLNVKIDCI